MKRITLLLAAVALVGTVATAQPQAPGCCDQGYTAPATSCCDQGYGTKRYVVAAVAGLLLLGAGVWHQFNRKTAY
jgi:hypothetical protein